MQPFKLLYWFNVATRTHAVIFVCDKNFIQQGKEARKLFQKSGLNFDKVRLLIGLGMGQVMETFDLLQLEVNDFEKNKALHDIFVISIAVIGYTRDLNDSFKVQDVEGSKRLGLSYDDSSFCPRYTLFGYWRADFTQIAFTEKSCALAASKSVHVIQLDNLQLISGFTL